jgi:class 3 adenylate cyclase
VHKQAHPVVFAVSAFAALASTRWTRDSSGGEMGKLPTGTVTFLFTDIEGSTRLLDALADRYGDALEAHDLILREAVAAHGGRTKSTSPTTRGSAAVSGFISSRARAVRRARS